MNISELIVDTRDIVQDYQDRDYYLYARRRAIRLVIAS